MDELEKVHEAPDANQSVSSDGAEVGPLTESGGEPDADSSKAAILEKIENKKKELVSCSFLPRNPHIFSLHIRWNDSCFAELNGEKGPGFGKEMDHNSGQCTEAAISRYLIWCGDFTNPVMQHQKYSDVLH